MSHDQTGPLGRRAWLKGPKVKRHNRFEREQMVTYNTLRITGTNILTDNSGEAAVTVLCGGSDTIGKTSSTAVQVGTLEQTLVLQWSSGPKWSSGTGVKTVPLSSGT